MSKKAAAATSRSQPVAFLLSAPGIHLTITIYSGSMLRSDRKLSYAGREGHHRLLVVLSISSVVDQPGAPAKHLSIVGQPDAAFTSDGNGLEFLTLKDPSGLFLYIRGV